MALLKGNVATSSRLAIGQSVYMAYIYINSPFAIRELVLMTLIARP